MSLRSSLLTAFLLLTPLETLARDIPSPPMRILVHITHGPEAPTRAVLAFNVAGAALEAGHTVTLFLAGDAVQLLRKSTLDQLTGLGTGELLVLFDALVTGGASFYLSGGSSRARGLTPADLGHLAATFGSPEPRTGQTLMSDILASSAAASGRSPE